MLAHLPLGTTSQRILWQYVLIPLSLTLLPLRASSFKAFISVFGRMLLVILIVLLSQRSPSLEDHKWHSGSPYNGNCLRYDGDNMAIRRASDAILPLVSNRTSPIGDDTTRMFHIMHFLRCICNHLYIPTCAPINCVKFHILQTLELTSIFHR